MKNLKKISRNELKSVVGGIGTNNGLPFCTKPRQIELWEMQCSPLDTEPCYAAGCRMK
ncbi:bacteriocin-like protein [Elizabethkingia miricola]|uniref:bacteriocin-like protein n=1 Tax=Elizabethkingia miricola TaxID=172045 RepID=UPI0038920624